jgi:hypothetical protein
MTGGSRRSALVAATIAAPLACRLLLRRRLLRWGATDAEVGAEFPGDDLIVDPNGGATMATTLPGPPEAVWPWLVQMGGGRGGWYSWDRLDNNGRPSAVRIVPEWQQLELGQQLLGPTNEFTVVALVPCRTLVLRSTYGLFTTHSFDPNGAMQPRPAVDGVWGFHLWPVTGGTRLVSRTVSRTDPATVGRVLGFFVTEVVHFAMQTRQFHNLRARVAATCITSSVLDASG